jgi:hypothetical protein
MTNDVPVQFVLGAARLESTPSGADVRAIDGTDLGQTPLNLLDVPPQTVQLNLSASGYEPVSVTLEITADQTNFCQTNLVSTRYVAAMLDAKEYLTAANYSAVVQATAEALNAKPGDADALALQNKANGYLNAERERLERLKRPRQVFDSLCLNNPNADLFAEHELKTSRPAKEVEADIVKSLRAAPSGFEILDDYSTVPETYRVRARQGFTLGILGGTERACLLVVGQTKDDETQILFKVLEYQVHHVVVANSLFNIKDEKQMTPISPSRIQMTDALFSQVNDGVRIVTERINSIIKE